MDESASEDFPPPGKRGSIGGTIAWLWKRPRLLLTLGVFIWSTNFVIGRHLAETFPPVALAFLRWLGATAILLPLAWPQLRADWPVIRRHWPLLLLMAATGTGAYNAMAYRGLQETEVVNALLTQSFAPMLIALWSLLLFGDWLTGRQLVGIVLSTAGVLLVLVRGDLAHLLSLRLNHGDLWLLAAMALYALYSALLRLRPSLHALSFLTVLIACGALMLLPLWIWEMFSGARPVINGESLLSLVYLALLPSIVAYLFFNRGVELLGANASGPYLNLMPLFGTVLAMLFLGEQLAWFHPVGFVLIVGGVALATTTRGAAPAPAS